MKQLFLITAFVLTTTFATAQNANRKFISQKQNGNQLDIQTSDGNYQIHFYNSNIVETSFIPKGEKFDPKSEAVILKPQNAITEIVETTKSIDFGSHGISVHIDKSPFKISYSYKGKELLSEKNGYSKTDKAEFLDFNLDTSEALYGGGARAIGMNRRGNKLQLYNRAHYGYGDKAELLNYNIPMVLSSKIYAIHFDNAPIGYLDLDSKKDNTLTYETISGRKTYQVIAADNWKNLTENFTNLTGKQPLPPRWAFGNFASRFGYHSEKETRDVVAKFRAEQIPLDAVILDLYWFGKTIQGTLGNFEFDSDNFPTPEKMIADFNKESVKTILITEPFVLTTSKKWQEAVDKKILATDKAGKPFTYDFYFGNTGLIDIFKPEGRDWFWDIYKKFTNKGVAGWWGDLGEPEVHPTDLQHATGSADEVHNIYGHHWAKLVSDGYQKDFPEVRPFILMRSGYSGSQRFGMIPWSGDVGRSWGGLQSQMEISLQMGMQGLGYMHSDLGGFAGDNVDNELYVRWLQYGVFQPVFRPHAAESVPPEVVFREPKTKALAVEAVKLRYQMLPYNYTLAFDNNQFGTPLMRPLFFEEPENRSLDGNATEYFWGNDFLVSPITKSGQTEKSIYFPKSNNWFDFYSNKKYIGGTTEKITLVENHIPVFVRGGAFIPMIDVIQSTESYSTKNLKLHFYYDASVTESAGKLYDDNGKTPDAFGKGQYELLHFKNQSNSKQIVISFTSEKGNAYISETRKVSLKIHNINVKPKKISIDGKSAKFTWNKNTNQLELPVIWEQSTTKNIIIQLAN